MDVVKHTKKNGEKTTEKSEKKFIIKKKLKTENPWKNFVDFYNTKIRKITEKLSADFFLKPALLQTLKNMSL